MSAPSRLVHMRLVRPLTLAGIQHPAGAIVELGVDSARQLLHLRRAAPVNEADRGRLLDFPRVTGY